MPHYDDTRPFVRKMKDIADKVEEKRVQFNEGRKQSGAGTLVGLEKLILKRKQEAQDAKRNRY